MKAAGSAEAMFGLARKNGVRMDACVAGMELADVAVADKRVVEHYTRNGIVPANFFSEDDLSDDPIEDAAEDDTSEDDTEDDTNNQIP